jgi:hypothetical protein
MTIDNLRRSFMTGMSWWNFAAMLVTIWIAADVLPSRYPLLNLMLILIAVSHAPILYVIHLVRLRRRGR